MIVEDEYGLHYDNTDYEPSPTVVIDYNMGVDSSFSAFKERFRQIRNKETHRNLQADLMDHLWLRKGTFSDDNNLE